MKRVYLDHASATPVRKKVVKAMLPYFDEYYGNPSTVYDMGMKIKQVIEEQRSKIAALIGANPNEIVFTSSGAESNNMAIKGSVLAQKKKGNHIIVSAIEHHSVLNSARFFERFDYEVTFLPVDSEGLVDPKQLEKAIRPETVLVSIMHANNEIGTIEPVAELSAVCKRKGVLFHTDAVASVGNIPVDVKELDVDLLSLSGVSLGAPKGIGVLFFRDNLRLMPLIHGGIQEKGRRGGTENVPAIVGLGTAAELVMNELPDKMNHLQNLRDRLITGIGEKLDHTVLTGHPEKRLPGHASFCIEAIEGESLIFMLSKDGIYANTGSACASKALKVSPVLTAAGIPAALAQGSVVFTLDSGNTGEEIEYVLEKLPISVERLRSLSPLWQRRAPFLEEAAG